MMLRSQGQAPQKPRAELVSIRDLMRDHDQQVQKQNDNKILPPSLTDPFYQPETIIANLPIFPPPHIESESQISISEIAREVPRERTPRRRKIFQRKGNVAPVMAATPVRDSKPMGSLARTPQFSPNLNQSQPQSQQQPRKSSMQSNPAQNSSASIYNTVPSMKKTKDNRNNTVYEQPGSNFILEPSGISLRSRQPSVSFNQSQSQERDVPPAPVLKNTVSKMIPEGTNQKPGNMSKLERNVVESPPLPVYESKFYKPPDQNKGEELLHGLLARDPRLNPYQPYYSNMGPGQRIMDPQNKLLQDALAADYRQYERRQTDRPYSLGSPQSSGVVNSPSFAYNFQQTSISSNQPIIMGPSQPQPVYQARPPPTFTPQPPSPSTQMYAMSPFEQNEREELRQMPRRFQQIENQVQRHQNQLEEVNRKIAETQINELESQKALLNQLILKEQQLNQKQRQINDNLEQMAKMQWDSNLKKQQILKYQLQIQQAKRLEELQNQNQRLIHQLIKKKQKSNASNVHTRDFTLPPRQEANRSISFLRGNRSWAEEWNDGELHELLSPFSVKPEYY